MFNLLDYQGRKEDFFKWAEETRKYTVSAELDHGCSAYREILRSFISSYDDAARLFNRLGTDHARYVIALIGSEHLSGVMSREELQQLRSSQNETIREQIENPKSNFFLGYVTQGKSGYYRDVEPCQRHLVSNNLEVATTSNHPADANDNLPFQDLVTRPESTLSGISSVSLLTSDYLSRS